MHFLIMKRTMNKIVLFFLKKFFRSPKKEWLKFDTMFMILGIIISVSTLTVALAIFDGYEKALKNTILDVNSHIYIFSSDDKIDAKKAIELDSLLSAQEEIACFGKIVVTQSMCSNLDRVKGAIIRGIEWQNEQLPVAYHKFIFEGDYQLLHENDAVIGYRLAKELNLKLGDEFKIISSIGAKITSFGLQQKEKKLKVVGFYKSGMYEYDSKYVFINLETAAQFAEIPKSFTMMEIKLKENFVEKADYLAYKWEYLLDYKYQINSWIYFNSNLFTLLKLEKWIIFIILSFLVLIASFNVVSSVATTIIEKKQEIGILKTLGTSNYLLQKIFLFKTIFVAIFAITVGQIFGVLIAKFLSWQKFFALKGDVYLLDKIHVEFSVLSWSIILLTSLLIVFLASAIPLKKINNLKIIEVLRNQ